MKIGIDVTQLSRIKKAAENENFMERIFTEQEISYFSKGKIKWESVAGNFAAKEAFSKYLGTGIDGISFKDIELFHNEKGMPYICFKGERAKVTVSISHSEDTAVAVVCGEDDESYPHSGYIKSLIPKRKEDAHKGDCGRVFILAGSKGMTGAAALSAMGALRIGSGLVTVGTADCEQSVLAIKLNEAMTKGFASKNGALDIADREEIKELAEKADAFVIGPGMGRNKETTDIIRWLVKNVKTPMVIDADGLNALSKNIDILKRRQGQTVLTPHEGEMALLCNKTPEEIKADRKAVAEAFSKEYGVTLVLKGKDTIVSGEETFINPTGNSGMATGGSGDVLSGIIGGLIAQGLSPYNAAVLGVYVHGRAGDIAATDKGKMGIIAGDIAENIPYAVKEISGE